jgi:sigma-B regulation protein RsbU (phosphoserine phosphatase)
MDQPSAAGQTMSNLMSLFGDKDWREQMAFVVASMRELSSQTDPQQMNETYRRRIRTVLPVDASLSISRRGLSTPDFRITRSTRWQTEINPWKEKDRLPLLRGGFGAELIYGDEPRLVEDVAVPASDPLFEYLDGYRSLAAIPMYEQGVSLNMVLLLRREPHAFDPEQFPQIVWMSNLYGRATHSLVLSEELKQAYEAVDYDLRVVADIQRSLLPPKIPHIPTMGLAAHYQTAHRAGGDYYDFFALDDGRWGLFIADVSGHGTPAAVLMAVTHSLAHTWTGKHDRPGALLEYLNSKLHELYTRRSDTFVTAFYGIYEPESRRLTWSSAGHNPPRLKRCEDGSLALLDKAGGLPLGIDARVRYPEAVHQLRPGDQLILYTDGITEAYDTAGQMFGLARLDKVLENCADEASDLLRAVLEALDEFTGGKPAHDDRTILVAKIT